MTEPFNREQIDQQQKECSGPFTDARDCPVHAPKPQAEELAQLRAENMALRKQIGE